MTKFMKQLFLLSSFVQLTALVSCKSFYDLNNYAKSKTKGSISTGEWQYAYGYTDPEAKLPDGMEIMIILTTAKPKHACPDVTDKLADTREVVITVDGKPGEMKIGGSNNRLETEADMFTYKKSERIAQVSFHDPSLPEAKRFLFATRGKVKISKITANSIEGAIVAKFDQTNFVNGQFKAKICKYGQLN
jgi:hypothetical protein